MLSHVVPAPVWSNVHIIMAGHNILFTRDRDDRERESASKLPCAGYFPNANNSRSWDGVKAWTWEFGHGLSCGWAAGTQPLELTTCFLPCIHWQEAGNGIRAWTWTQALHDGIPSSVLPAVPSASPAVASFNEPLKSLVINELYNMFWAQIRGRNWWFAERWLHREMLQRVLTN